MAITIENCSFSTFLSVDFGDSTGSGFRISVGKEQFIVTAKHVIYNKGRLLSDLWIKSRNYDGGQEAGYSAKIDLNEHNVIEYGELDIVLIKLDNDHNYVLENAGTNISLVTQEDLLKFDGITIGSNIFLIGFPSSLTVDDFYDVDRPLLRTGIVAGKNINNDTFIIDSLAYYGVSGGPVVQIDSDNNLRVIGIVSRFVPFVTEWRNKHESSVSRQDFYNSGYAVCLPLDRVIETIDIQK